MLRPQDRGPLFVRLEASPFFAWLSRWAREGPAGVDSSRLVWTPSGPEMPRAPTGQTRAQQGFCCASGHRERGRYSVLGRELAHGDLARGPRQCGSQPCVGIE